jgi:hypothetical protein
MATSKDRLRKTLNYYLPNSFVLTLSDMTLPIAQHQKSEFTLFIHEYTHLLQNLFTISGWASFAYESVKYEALLDIIEKQRQYDVPVYDSLTDGAQKRKIDRCNDYSDYLCDLENIPEDAVICATDKTHNLEATVVQDFPMAKDNRGIRIYSEFLVNGVKRRVRISYSVLVESMAYLVEQHYSLADKQSPDYPYDVLGVLFRESPLKTRMDFQIVMIYLSLQSLFPDIQFRNIYEVVINRRLYDLPNVEVFAKAIIDALSYHFRDGIASQITGLYCQWWTVRTQAILLCE